MAGVMCAVFSLILTCGAMKPPNFVFVLTDDQDLLLNSLITMEETVKLVANSGLTFTNSFVNSPICCPSRSTILSGQFAHNVQVFNNSIEGGCASFNWQHRHEQTTIAAQLKTKRNYRTFYAGKYLNQYGNKAVGGTAHVPVGYDWWLGLRGNSKYYNYTLSINGTAKFFADNYLTDKISDYAMEFLDTSQAGDSFFMMLAPPAAHAPFTPASRHSGKFSNVTAVRNGAFNYTSSDKHWLVQMPPQSLPSDVRILDEIQRNRLRTLQAVDELVAKIVQKLEKTGLIDETYVIFTSDNGFHIGQFTQPWDKRQPYESDIRVPFLIRGPGIDAKTLSDFPISSVDIAPTILDLAGIKMETTDGKSFKSQLFSTNSSRAYDNVILLEYWGEGDSHTVDPKCPWGESNQLAECSPENWCKCQDSKNNTYACVVRISNDQQVKFCRFDDGFIEVYNLKTDPYELVNLYDGIINIGHYEKIFNQMRNCQGGDCIYQK